MAFTQVIKTLGSVMNTMKSAVDTWLSSNITNPSNPPLDRSLSLANACAPADLVGNLKSELDDITKPSKNILKPEANKTELGITFSYNNGIYNLVGTKTNEYTRIIIGTITPSKTGRYTFSYSSENENTKPSAYIFNGTTQTAVWQQGVNNITVTLTAGNTYTLEVYIAPNEQVNYSIKIMCEYGTTPTQIVPYETLLNWIPDWDLSDYKFSILGVSIDTYYGWIPAGNVSYYNSTNLQSVDMTWWKKLIDKTGINLVINNSWSGACASTSNGLESSGVQRCLNLHNGSTIPDIIIIGMFGANDWVFSSLGNYSFMTSLPDNTTDLTDSAIYNNYKNTIESYKGAMATIFKRIHESYPKARIYALDMYNYYRGENLDPAGNSENHNIPIYNKALYDVAEWFGVTIIKGSECGINAINSRDYCVDASSGTALHPNESGHELIYKKVITQLVNDFCLPE